MACRMVLRGRQLTVRLGEHCPSSNIASYSLCPSLILVFTVFSFSIYLTLQQGIQSKTTIITALHCMQYPGQDQSITAVYDRTYALNAVFFKHCLRRRCSCQSLNIISQYRQRVVWNSHIVSVKSTR